MPRAFTLRPSDPADISAIHRIYAESVLNGVATYEIDPPSVEEMASRHAAITGQGFPFLIAETEETVLGYAYANAFRTRPAYRYLVEDSIYLDPAARGQGVGKALLERLIEECTARGFRQMVAVIGGAHPASIAVHAATGFLHCGRMEASGYKFDRWLDTVLMQRALGQGATTLPR